jgi:hypothetical protein
MIDDRLIVPRGEIKENRAKRRKEGEMRVNPPPI